MTDFIGFGSKGEKGFTLTNATSIANVRKFEYGLTRKKGLFYKDEASFCGILAY